MKPVALAFVSWKHGPVNPVLLPHALQALIHGLNRHYYSIAINYRKTELEEHMLLNLQVGPRAPAGVGAAGAAELLAAAAAPCTALPYHCQVIHDILDAAVV